jgi:DNA polymerase-3 subunit beta
MALQSGRLVLTVTNPDSGTATEEIEADYEAAGLEIGFNSRYLLDIAGQLDSDTGLFRLADPGSPTLVQDKGDASALYVLMPMRV